MTDSFFEIAQRVCLDCGGRCCVEARPPLSEERIQTLLENDVDEDSLEHMGYRRLRTRGDSFCIMFESGRCLIHSIKPETCVAGPFTFDVCQGRLRIFLKKESICPLVAELKKDQKAFRDQYVLAVQNITRLILALPPMELDIVCRIDEPETEMVGEVHIPEMRK